MGAGESQDALVARARHAYRSAFGRDPVWGGIAPGRVNLIGDHTDYTGGLALPMAIDLWCVAMAAPARDAARTVLISADRDEPAVLERGGQLAEAVGRLPAGHWSRYAAGVMAEFEGQAGQIPPLDIVVAGSVPTGSGLSSSAALEVAVATLLEEAIGAPLEAMKKARLCQGAEHRWAGVTCGLMDQMSAVMGRRGCALLMDFSALSATPVALPEDLAILVANSSVKHSLPEGTYGRIVEECERARLALGVASLREVSPEAAAGRMDEVEWELMRRVLHIATENARVESAAAAVRSGDLVALGGLMTESHRFLRDIYRVSCAELDAMVEILTDKKTAVVEGVYGARMTGAGFGGCIVAAVAPWAVQVATARLIEGYRQRCGRECDVFVVEASGGARGFTQGGGAGR